MAVIKLFKIGLQLWGLNNPFLCELRRKRKLKASACMSVHLQNMLTNQRKIHLTIHYLTSTTWRPIKDEFDKKKRRRLLEKSEGREWCMETKWREQIVKMCYWLPDHDSSQQVRVGTHVQVCGFTFVYLHLCNHGSLLLINAVAQSNGVSSYSGAVCRLPLLTNLTRPFTLTQHRLAEGSSWVRRQVTPKNECSGSMCLHTIWLVYYSPLKKQPH